MWIEEGVLYLHVHVHVHVSIIENIMQVSLYPLAAAVTIYMYTYLKKGEDMISVHAIYVHV